MEIEIVSLTKENEVVIMHYPNKDVRIKAEKFCVKILVSDLIDAIFSFMPSDKQKELYEVIDAYKPNLTGYVNLASYSASILIANGPDIVITNLGLTPIDTYITIFRGLIAVNGYAREWDLLVSDMPNLITHNGREAIAIAMMKAGAINVISDLKEDGKYNIMDAVKEFRGKYGG